MKKTSVILFSSAIIIFYAVLFLFGISCPILYLTGISCAGCGMTRATLALLKLDFISAFYYHPLVLLPAPLLFMWIFRNHLPKPLVKAIGIISLSLFIIVYIVRIIDPTDEIVVFEPQNGLIASIINYILY